ncbi:MAG: hypothetical protein WCX31_14370 [Salinivirgaceae bacterium]|jgi:hypothetical protein
MRINENTADIRFFRVYRVVNAYEYHKTSGMFSDEELQDIKTANKNERVRDIAITPDNWNELKETFYNQRLEKFPASYYLNEKINLELETIEKLTINETDFQILKDRYKEFLLKKVKTTQLEPEYFITSNSLTKAHTKFNGEIWKELDIKDFISIFDLNERNKKELISMGDGELVNMVYLFMKLQEKENFKQAYIEKIIPVFRGYKSKIKKGFELHPTRKKEINALF